jgi:hypothetical protein
VNIVGRGGARREREGKNAMPGAVPDGVCNEIGNLVSAAILLLRDEIGERKITAFLCIASRRRHIGTTTITTSCMMSLRTKKIGWDRIIIEKNK